MVANGHFAGSADGQDSSSYEHGVQVIDEDKEFKYALHWLFSLAAPTLNFTIYTHIY